MWPIYVAIALAAITVGAIGITATIAGSREDEAIAKAMAEERRRRAEADEDREAA